MFEELIGNLMACSRCDFGQDCGRCTLKSSETTFCCDVLLHEAADAIEELQKDLERTKDFETFWQHEAEDALRKFQVAIANKPQWIPVTERLPEEYTDVLCYYEYFRYGDYNCMFRTIDRGYYGNGRWGGEAGQGHKNKVLAWMPLPEPPKTKECE